MFGAPYLDIELLLLRIADRRGGGDELLNCWFVFLFGVPGLTFRAMRDFVSSFLVRRMGIDLVLLKQVPNFSLLEVMHRPVDVLLNHS